MSEENTSLMDKVEAEVTKKEQAPAETQTNEQSEQDENPTDVHGPLVLDKHDKFVFQGQEYTPEELNKAMLRQADYTKKTQAIASEKKFYDNLDIDLENVRNNPELADQFKTIYPEKFHKLVNLVLNTGSDDRAPEDDTDGQNIPQSLQKKIDEMQRKLDAYDAKFHDEKLEATNAYIDATFSNLQKQYTLADEDAVINEAQRLISENSQNPNFKMTDEAWERLFRRDHEMREKSYSEYYTNKLKAQEKKNKEAHDGGPGGLAPGRERKRISFDEATEMAIQDLGGR